jgi:hypothetical protein
MDLETWKCLQQCSGSVTFWYGSGPSDPYLRITDPDADPALFVSEFQIFNFFIFFCLLKVGSGSGPVQINYSSGWDSIGPKDPDPEHWCTRYSLI